ncbi:hypothetical protein EVAR_34784_1 [Eumeta japonica]|uniref:Uncharacterized protein n=1 Tax=Eumeta variegata TaxID=151549 RepID=A0A4C1WB55_EUMVA|nr:hypothetical protein EVAR_34784_1 [Eumeta japonica]
MRRSIVTNPLHASSPRTWPFNRLTCQLNEFDSSLPICQFRSKANKALSALRKSPSTITIASVGWER